MRKLLIATTNPGKIAEIQQFLETLPFELITLADLKEKVEAPEESEDTLEKNALLKAKYYAEKTGLLTLADDTGLFVDALDGWPGIRSGRTAPTAPERQQLLLKKLEEVENRSATFHCILCVYDPEQQTTFISAGELKGRILSTHQDHPSNIAFAYNSIFYLEEVKKTYAELSVTEKNSLSHRSKALLRIKYHLQNTYSAKNIVVPFAMIIKEGKVLMSLRNDPHRPEYHRKWEFPGGGVEFGESMHENVVREVKEEVGCEVEIVKLLQHIAVEAQTYPTWKYQVFLVPYVCKMVGGEVKPRDEEVLEVQWFELDEVLKKDLIGENHRMYEIYLEELKQVIKDLHL